MYSVAETLRERDSVGWSVCSDRKHHMGQRRRPTTGCSKAARTALVALKVIKGQVRSPWDVSCKQTLNPRKGRVCSCAQARTIRCVKAASPLQTRRDERSVSYTAPGQEDASLPLSGKKAFHRHVTMHLWQKEWCPACSSFHPTWKLCSLSSMILVVFCCFEDVIFWI